MGEASEMSMVSGVDASSATTGADTGAENKGSATPLLLLLLLFLFAIGTIIGVQFLFGTSEASTPDATPDDGGPPANGVGPRPAPPAARATPPSPGASPLTGTDTTTATNTSATAAASTATGVPTPRPKSGLEYTLFCTYGGRLNSTMTFPPDGMCDYIFFDSLHSGGRNILGTTFEPAVTNFFTVAATWNKTKFGVSVSSEHVAAAKAKIAGNANILNQLWNLKVYNHGILDVDTSKLTSVGQVDEIFSLLKDLRDYQNFRKAGQGVPTITAIGVTFLSPRTGAIYDKLESNLKNSLVSVVIARTHLSKPDKGLPNCHVTGPAVYDMPFADYQAGMVEVLVYLTAKNGFSWGFATYVSVTMKALWYKPKTNSFDFGSACKSHPDEPYDPYVYICDYHEYQANLKMVPFPSMVMIAHNPSTAYAFTYDSPETIKNKYCKARENYHEYRYGLALYDIEYEDYKNSCAKMNPFGAFSRLAAAKKVLEYVSSAYLDSSPTGCLNLNYTAG